jgi:hypothetical protein
VSDTEQTCECGHHVGSHNSLLYNCMATTDGTHDTRCSCRKFAPSPSGEPPATEDELNARRENPGWLDRLQAAGKQVFAGVTDAQLLAIDAEPVASPSGAPPTRSDTRTLCAVCGIWQCLARHGGGTCHAVNGPADVSCGACYANRPTIQPDLTVPVASPVQAEPPTERRALYIQLRDAIASLQAENAALRKDAERIARLEALGRIRIYDPQSIEDAWEIRRDEWSAGDLLRSVTIGYGADLRDAIDDTAARLPADPGGRE